MTITYLFPQLYKNPLVTFRVIIGKKQTDRQTRVKALPRQSLTEVIKAIKETQQTAAREC